MRRPPVHPFFRLVVGEHSLEPKSHKPLWHRFSTGETHGLQTRATLIGIGSWAGWRAAPGGAIFYCPEPPRRSDRLSGSFALPLNNPHFIVNNTTARWVHRLAAGGRVVIDPQTHGLLDAKNLTSDGSKDLDGPMRLELRSAPARPAPHLNGYQFGGHARRPSHQVRNVVIQ